MSPPTVEPEASEVPIGTVRRRRIDAVRRRMEELAIDVLLLSHGADLPWLTGYRAMPLERLTMLVLSLVGDPVLLVPQLEAPKVPDDPSLFRLHPWGETDDPLDLVAGLVGNTDQAMGLSDRAWAVTLLGLQRRLPSARFLSASAVTGPLRAVKDAAEVRALRSAASAADRVAEALQRGDIALVGRTERAVSEEISTRLLAEGHHRVNFAIVGSGPNAASPHHDASERRIEPGELVVCDFGGELALADDGVGYCSDI
ncbi:MAG TPA: aminopeptidase P family N-terminal domain-containing protein, partial [Acidimicrobiales bacterium]|nr:aminopeptidase P family N-terminal domain-containing protein [Acidimicrobiales bacterium]